ncbi:MAG: sulfotransferase [Pseudomonadota bacterium]
MAQKAYSWGARVLHHIALSRAVAEVSFDLEKSVFSIDPSTADDGQHVFVAGLARAGTTILMRNLYETGAFCSLSYRDMPFVTAPNLWAKLTAGARTTKAAEQRAHGDGILVDFDSPEALEEVFWRVHCGDDYILSDMLVPMTFDAEVASAFRSYVAAIMQAGGAKRYLSKNNNSILRLPALAKCLQDASFIVPFRSPLQHAMSLQRQHETFSAMHGGDAFSLRYMQWLVHHEFGLDHRPFVFKEDELVALNGDSPNRLNYWLRLWLHVHRHLLDTAPEKSLLVAYERLCTQTEIVWSRLCDHLNLERATVPAFDLRETKVDADYDLDLNEQCQDCYDRLLSRSL